MMTESGEQLKLVGGGEFFAVNSRMTHHHHGLTHGESRLASSPFSDGRTRDKLFPKKGLLLTLD
jgi:hypothetical protein